MSEGQVTGEAFSSRWLQPAGGPSWTWPMVSEWELRRPGWGDRHARTLAACGPDPTGASSERPADAVVPEEPAGPGGGAPGPELPRGWQMPGEPAAASPGAGEDGGPPPGGRSVRPAVPPGRADEAAPSMLGFLVGATGMFATMYSTQAILPQLSHAFGVPPSEAGLSISVTVLLVAAGAWIWGAYSDRHGRRRTILLASGLLVVPTAALAAVPSFGLLLACRAAQGLCMPGLLTVGVPYIGEVFAPRLAGRAMGYYVVALVVGGLVGRLGVALLAAGIGWQGALASLAVLPCAGTVMMWRSLPEGPASTHTGLGFAAVAAHLRNPRLRRAIVAGGALLFVFVGVFSYVVYRLQAPPFALDPQISSLVFVLWVVGAIGPSAGKLADRWGWRRAGFASLVSAAAGTALTLAPSLPAVIAGLGLLAAGMFSGVTVVQLGVAASTDVDRGTASGLYFSCYYGAGALGAYLLGLAWQSWGWSGVALLAVGVLACAAVTLAAPLRARPAPG